MWIQRRWRDANRMQAISARFADELAVAITDELGIEAVGPGDELWMRRECLPDELTSMRKGLVWGGNFVKSRKARIHERDILDGQDEGGKGASINAR